MHTAAHTHTILQAGVSNPTHQIGHVIASKAPALATEVGENITSKSVAKASLKTTSKAAFDSEVGSEAVINGKILGTISGVAFGVNLLLEIPFKIHQRCLQTRL